MPSHVTNVLVGILAGTAVGVDGALDQETLKFRPCETTVLTLDGS